jgi:hypothetical protein
MVKSPPPAALTTKLTVVECTNDPLVPVMVKLYVPADVVELVETDSVELPEPATEVGLKLPLAPVGAHAEAHRSGEAV